jgi:hypothetical protein
VDNPRLNTPGRFNIALNPTANLSVEPGQSHVSSRVRWKAADDGAAAVDELSHEPGDVAADASGDFAEEMAAESAVVPAQGSLGV